MQENDLIINDDNILEITIEGESFEIGDSFFPLDNEDLEYFMYDNCKEIKLAKLINAINKLDFEEGRCYTNTDKLVELGKELDIDIKFYSGWLFLGVRGIHHAWAVIETNFGYQIIDPSVSEKTLEIFFNIEMKDDNDWRDEVVKKLKKLDKLKNSEKMILGKPIKGSLYAGCNSDSKSARNTFLELRERHPDHPSYIGGADMYGKSKLQKKLIKENDINGK